MPWKQHSDSCCCFHARFHLDAGRLVHFQWCYIRRTPRHIQKQLLVCEVAKAELVAAAAVVAVVVAADIAAAAAAAAHLSIGVR